ncbi:hypothetical protein ZWY2020_016302 [Hordeum vulgare]|nr:hypothetical protein ZWY2020_016302 [Hordeum vulgare]
MGRPRGGSFGGGAGRKPSPLRVLLHEANAIEHRAAGRAAAAAAPSTDQQPKMSLHTMFSVPALQMLSGAWNQFLNGIATDLGMSGLGSIPDLGNISRLFSLFTLSRIDPETMKMDMGNGVFIEVNEELVTKIIGVRSGDRVIDINGSACLPDRDVLLAKLHTLLGTGVSGASNIPLVRVKRILQVASKKCMTAGEAVDEAPRIRAAYTIVAGATFLFPRGRNAKIPNELIAIATKPAELGHYNYARYVVDGLREGASKEGDGAQSPTPVVIFSSSRPAGQGQDGGTPHISVGVPLGAVPCDKLIGAMTSTLGFYSKMLDQAREETEKKISNAIKLMDAHKEVLLKEIGATCPAKRKKEMEETLAFFLAEVARAEVPAPVHANQTSTLPTCSSIWFRHDTPTPLEITGHKMKHQYDLDGEMTYHGMDAKVREFNEQEVLMMVVFDDPVWRCLTSPDASLYMSNLPNEESSAMLGSLFSTTILGYQLRACRLIMAPILLSDDWSLYIFDRKFKRVNVLDPMYTDQGSPTYKKKHQESIGGQSTGYIMYYAEYFDGFMLDEDIPDTGLPYFDQHRVSCFRVTQMYAFHGCEALL